MTNRLTQLAYSSHIFIGKKDGREDEGGEKMGGQREEVGRGVEEGEEKKKKKKTRKREEEEREDDAAILQLHLSSDQSDNGTG